MGVSGAYSSGPLSYRASTILTEPFPQPFCAFFCQSLSCLFWRSVVRNVQFSVVMCSWRTDFFVTEKESLSKLGIVAHAFNTSTREKKAGQPRLHSEFQSSQSYIAWPWLKKRSLYTYIYWLTKTSSYCVAQAGFELLILLPQPLECWDYRYSSLLCFFPALNITGFLLNRGPCCKKRYIVTDPETNFQV